MRSILPPLLLAFSSSTVFIACGEDAPKEWWQMPNACPDGAEAINNRTDIFCQKEDGTLHGRYDEIGGNGKTVWLSGQYNEGKRHGTWTQYSDTGEVLGTYKFNNGVGTVVRYRADGSIKSEISLDGDVKHGKWAKWHDTKPLRVEEGEYDRGKPMGTWTYRDSDNAITKEVDYKDGKMWETRHFEKGVVARTELSDEAKAARKKEREEALATLGTLQGGAFASLTGTADFSSGLDDQDVYGGLLGTQVGQMQGGWGYGVSGTGPGGGGTGWGTIGTGKYGSIGSGSGYGTGSGRGGMRGRAAPVPKVRIGSASATGDLDKNIIRRYIRRKLRVIRNCYERELLVEPKLKGKIVVKFMINPKGDVQGVTADGMGNKKVESCMARVIRSIKFPRPKNGGRVNVTYPFTFSPS